MTFPTSGTHRSQHPEVLIVQNIIERKGTDWNASTREVGDE